MPLPDGKGRYFNLGIFQCKYPASKIKTALYHNSKLLYMNVKVKQEYI